MNSKTIAILAGLLTACSTAPKGTPLPDLDINEPTRLIEHSARGNEAEVKAMLVAGEKADRANSQGMTPLMVAARKGQVGVMQLLITARANVALADEQGSTALHYAVLGNQTKAAELLLQNHAPPDVKDGFDLTPLMLAVRFGDLTMVKTLIKYKANVATPDQNGWSAIFFAISRGEPNIFDVLADALGEFQMQDVDGDGLVNTAVEYRQNVILRKLLDLHAPANFANKRKATPIRTAIENGDLDSIRILSKVISINEKFTDGRTPLMLAIDLRQKDAAALLINLKADLTTKDQAGKTYMDHLTALGLDTDWLDGSSVKQ